MNKSQLMDIAKRIAAEAELKSYAYWSAQEFPIIYEESFNEEDVCIEIDILSVFGNCIQIGVGVAGVRDSGWLARLFAMRFVGYSFIVCADSDSKPKGDL